MKSKFLLFFLSCVAGVVICEIIIRIFNLTPQVIDYVGEWRFVDNPQMVYELVPGKRGIGSDSLNNQGFNDYDFVKKKSYNVVRIAMLGDSIAQGVGVLKNQTFSKQLEKLLNKRAVELGSVTRYEVMNFGVGGYNLAAEVETLRTKVLQYSPDIIILNMFFNDDEPIPGVQRLFCSQDIDERQQLEIVKRYITRSKSLPYSFITKLLRKSRLYLFLLSRLHADREGEAALNNLKDSVLKDSDRSWGQSAISRGFSEIELLKGKYNFKFLICIHSSLLYYWHPNEIMFVKTARSFQFPYFRMFKYFREEGVSPADLQLKDYPEDKCHPNVYGHSLIAKAMFLQLKKNNFIDNAM